jgi:HK97 family phage major capsid protein
MREDELVEAIRVLEDEARDRTFDDEEKERWNDLNAELDEYRTRRERVAELARNPANTEPGSVYEPTLTRTRFDETAPQHVRAAHDEGLRTIDRNLDVLSAAAADNLNALIRARDPLGLDSRYLAAAGSPAYATAFSKMLGDPQQGHLRFDAKEVEAVRLVSEVMQQRALAEGAGPTGGFAIPITIDPSVMLSSNGALNPIRQIANVTTVATREWRGVASDGVVASYVAESTAATDASPTLVQPTIFAQQWRAFVPFSIELGNDWAGIQQELLRLVSDAKDVLESQMFYNGTGTNQPFGVQTSLTTTQRVQTVGAGAFAIADLYTFKQALPARFIPNASFAWHPTRLDAIYRFVAAGSTTEPQIMPDGRGGPLLGKPAYEWTAMPTAVTTGTKIGLYGDFKAGYQIADRLGITSELIPHLFGAAQGNLPTGQRGLYVYGRNGANVVVPNALRYLEAL